MNEPEYAAWRERTIPAYAADKVASGQWSAEDSLALSRKEHGELLPNGLATPDNVLFVIEDHLAVSVGMLWIGVKTKFNARIAFVFNIEINPEHQRLGHAFRAFNALEAEVLRLGLSGIALHVFGHNKSGQALYAKLGFEPTNISLYKRMGTAVA